MSALPLTDFGSVCWDFLINSQFLGQPVSSTPRSHWLFICLLAPSPPNLECISSLSRLLTDTGGPFYYLSWDQPLLQVRPQLPSPTPGSAGHTTTLSLPLSALLPYRTGKMGLRGRGGTGMSVLPDSHAIPEPSLNPCIQPTVGQVLMVQR